ncbi:MAG: hypothetical protein DMF17_05985 [Verrucomicrobia bacterium]|nr:MAG: hypothetical protein DMF17_05985 [Verrucomicrobiota bacterium]
MLRHHALRQAFRLASESGFRWRILILTTAIGLTITPTGIIRTTMGDRHSTGPADIATITDTIAITIGDTKRL